MKPIPTLEMTEGGDRRVATAVALFCVVASSFFPLDLLQS